MKKLISTFIFMILMISTLSAYPPGVPTNVIPTPYNGYVEISFNSPSYMGTPPFGGFIVTSSPGNATVTTKGTNTLRISVGGLHNGTQYTFTVVAYNNDGSSAASSPSAPVTPFESIGDIFTNGNIYYKITSITNHTVAVIHKPDYGDYTGDVVIPATVTNDLTTYTVTSISSGALGGATSKITSVIMPNTITTLETGVFSSCSTLTSVTLSTLLTKIPDYTFSNCTSLRTVTCLIKIPPTISTSAGNPFYTLSYQTFKTVYVPAESLTLYKATNWNDYAGMQLTALSTAIETPTESNYLVKTSDNTITISNVNGKSIKAFDLSGRIVFETRNAQETEQFTVSNKGIYVISIDNFRKKIAIY